MFKGNQGQVIKCSRMNGNDLEGYYSKEEWKKAFGKTHYYMPDWKSMDSTKWNDETEEKKVYRRWYKLPGVKPFQEYYTK